MENKILKSEEMQRNNITLPGGGDSDLDLWTTGLSSTTGFTPRGSTAMENKECVILFVKSIIWRWNLFDKTQTYIEFTVIYSNCVTDQNVIQLQWKYRFKKK